MKVVYMGTPGFACRPLEALCGSEHEVQAVVTGQTKRRSRRGAPCPTDVCCTATDLGLPILTPRTLKSKKLHDQLAELKPDVFVVIAFRILPASLLDVPRLGAINVHGSLLPRYRGAAPIHWAIINGETETGLTSFFLKEQVDAGNIILRTKTEIKPDDTYDSLYARLSEMSGPFLLDTLSLIEDPEFEPLSQDETLATPAPKITPFDAMIDWGFPAGKVHNFIRGLSSRPGAWTLFRGRKLKVLRSARTDHPGLEQARPGTIIPNRRRLLVQCSRSAIELTRVVPEGRKPMDGVAFINGQEPREGEILGEKGKEVREVN